MLKQCQNTCWIDVPGHLHFFALGGVGSACKAGVFGSQVEALVSISGLEVPLEVLPYFFCVGFTASFIAGRSKIPSFPH